jgi:hypothetical protein
MYIYVYIYMYIYVFIYIIDKSTHTHTHIYRYIWLVPRCSGRMERRGFVIGLVPDLWNVMRYKLYININLNIMYIVYMYLKYFQGHAR